MTIKNYLILSGLFILVLWSCNSNDDGIVAVPANDRGEQAATDDALLVSYLNTHFYNYEEYLANPNSTNFNIVIDTISGDNSNKTSLMSQVKTIMVNDLTENDVVYKLYVLKVREGAGVQPKFSDSTFVQYSGNLLDGTVFDSAVNPL